jgi:hypothetical protein
MSMSEDAIGRRSRWTIAAVGALALTATFLFLVRLPPLPVALPTPPAPQAAPGTAVKMARPDSADMVLMAETELRDLRPLFLPTARNAALPDPRLEAARTFLDEESSRPGLGGDDLQISKELPPVVALEGVTPLDALSPDLAVPGFGRAEVKIQPFAARGGFIEVVATKDGRQVLAEPLPVASRPPGDKSWAPIEYLAVVDSAGLASPLVVTEGSRVEEVDVYFRNYLTRDFRIGARLEAGFYRITVAP